MDDRVLEPYWEAVKEERYGSHLERLPSRLHRVHPSRPASPAPRRVAWACGVLLAAVMAGFAPVQTARPAGTLIEGRTESQGVSQTLHGLEALGLPAGYNLSVSEGEQGTTFALFLPEDVPGAATGWRSRVGAAVAATDVRVRAVEVAMDRALWATLLERLGVTISASGTEREALREQVARQLEALGSGRGEVEHLVGPDGRETVRITIEDLP